MVSSLTQPIGEASLFAERREEKENPQLEPQDTQKIGSIRHTCAHIMAMAVQKLYPEIKVAIEP